jgi:hypothetical protein
MRVLNVIAAPMNHTLAGTTTLHVRIGTRTVSDLIERRFAEFAGVPYQNPLSRQQWEELWEAEP